MALLDFLKNKKEKDKAKEKKAERISVEKRSEKGEAPVVEAKASLQGQGFSYEVVKEPHISEKSTILGEKNKYVFKVQSDANKLEIKKAVEGIYGVNVLSISTINIPKKKRRLGRTQGFKKAYRKAVVTLKEGQKIELF